MLFFRSSSNDEGEQLTLPENNNEMTINNLADNSLVKIFCHLPVEDVLRYSRVCCRWDHLVPFSCSSRRALFLYDARCISISMLRYMYIMFNTTFDAFNQYRVTCESLSEDFAKSILKQFPLVERLEIAIDCDNKILPFLFALLKGYSSRLTHLKLVTCFLDRSFHHVNEHLLFYRLSTFLRDECPLPKLVHLTLYNQTIGFSISENISLPFEAMPRLEELNYGMPCNSNPLKHALSEMKKAPMLRQFATLFDRIDHETPTLHTYFDELEDHLCKQLTHFTIFYTHYFMDVSQYFDSLTKKLTNLQYLHICLKHERIHIDDLLNWLARLPSLRHLQLSSVPLNYLTTKFQEYYIDASKERKSLPQLKSVKIFKFSYIKWENYNGWENAITWRQISPLVNKCFPSLEEFHHSHIRSPEFVKHNVKHISTKYKTFSGTTLEAPKEGALLSLQKSLEFDLPANLVTLDTSQFMIPLSLLMSVISETVLLRNLTIRAPRHFFTEFSQLKRPDVCLSSLAVLHLDHISTGSGDPSDIIPCLDFLQTAPMWPNLEKIKLDGLDAKYNFFDLSTRETEWLRSLPAVWPQLTEVFILTKNAKAMPKKLNFETEFLKEESTSPKAHFQVTYLLDEKITVQKKASAKSRRKQLLTVIHESSE